MTITSGVSGSRNLWQALSTDTKPTDSRVLLNDRLFETDTGKYYLYCGATVGWVAYSTPGTGGGSVSSITSTGGSITVTNGSGPTVNIEVSGSPAVNSVTASPATSQSNYSPTGYVGGTTNRLRLAAASGGSTITGLLATGVPDNFTILIQNTSASDVLIFTHLDAGSSSANQFSNQNAGSVEIPKLGAARCTYIVNKWQFA